MVSTDTERRALHTLVEAYAKEHNLDYVTALQQLDEKAQTYSRAHDVDYVTALGQMGPIGSTTFDDAHADAVTFDDADSDGGGTSLLAVREDGETMALDAPVPAPVHDDEESMALDEEVRSYSAEHDVDYFTALGRMSTGDAFYRSGDAPDERLLQAADGQGSTADPERVELDRRARSVAQRLEVSYFDAIDIIEAADTFADVALRPPPERSNVPWLDLGRRETPPRPYSQEDWEIDRRRAALAGIAEFTYDEWKDAAEQGTDLVFEYIEERREKELVAARAPYENLVAVAQRREAERRTAARHEGLRTRAKDLHRRADERA